MTKVSEYGTWLTAAIFAVFLVGCEPQGPTETEIEASKSVPASSHPQRAEIITQLKEAQSQTEDPFVIITIKGTESFVQYWVADGEIEYDRPKGDLSEAEFDQVVEAHAEIGVTAAEITITDVETDGKSQMVVLNKEFPYADVEAATDLGLYVLETCFGLTNDKSLVIECGWK